MLSVGRKGKLSDTCATVSALFGAAIASIRTNKTSNSYAFHQAYELLKKLTFEITSLFPLPGLRSLVFKKQVSPSRSSVGRALDCRW